MQSKPYLVWFGHNNSYFAQRFRELEAVAHRFGVARADLYLGEAPSSLSTDPYAIVRLPNDELAARICENAVLTKAIIELWGSGTSDDEVIVSIKQCVSDDDWASHFKGSTFSYKVIGYGMQHTDRTRRDRMNAFSSLFQGYEQVDIKTASTVLYIIDEHEHNFDQTGTRNELIQAAKKRTFYGRQVAVADSTHRSKFLLTERPVLGPTSLDNDLAFLMANMAEINPGNFVFDPFCGTGGLLITAAACGGIPHMGTDIDVRVLRGECVAYIKNKVSETMGTDIFQNFKHYNLPLPEVVACDNSHNCWRIDPSAPNYTGLVDVILTDPPYGVRAGAKKIGAKSVHQIENRDDYYPQMLGYSADEVNSDLLSLSSDLLVDGGFLVFLLHIELIDLFSEAELEVLRKQTLTTDQRTSKRTQLLVNRTTGKEFIYANECARDVQFLDESLLEARVIPQHPNLELISAVLQILSAGTGRILVKMKRNRRGLLGDARDS